MSLMKKFGSALVGMIALAAGSGAPPAVAADIQWRTHLVWIPTRQEVVATQKLAERITARGGDQFAMEVHPGGALGIKDADMLRILPPGNVIQATLFSTNYVARDSPAIAYAFPEGVVKTTDNVAAMLPELERVYADQFDQFGIKALNILVPPDRSMEIYCKTPVNTLEELRKKKMRVWGAFLVDVFAELGVSATVIPQNDLYMALQTGVVDCALFLPGAANTSSIGEVAPHWSTISDYLAPLVLIVSRAAWDKLPSEVQAMVTEESEKMSKELLSEFMSGEYNKEQLEKFNQSGGKELEPFPEADREAFYQAALKVWERNATDGGGNMAANREAILKQLR